MKATLFLVTILMSMNVLAGTCPNDNILATVNKSVSDAYTPGPKAKVHLVATLQPGEAKNLIIGMDDYDFKNRTVIAQDYFEIVGSSLASDTTIFLAIFESNTCKILKVQEMAYTGGGGL